MLRMKNIQAQQGCFIKGQAAVEYMLLFASIVSIVLIGLKVYAPRTTTAGDMYFNRVGSAILGNPNPCGDGVCSPTFENVNSCCADCGGCAFAN